MSFSKNHKSCGALLVVHPAGQGTSKSFTNVFNSPELNSSLEEFIFKFRPSEALLDDYNCALLGTV